jgi:hypothetical protein
MHDELTRAPGLDGTDARSQPSVMAAVTRRDRRDTRLWWPSILAFFMEGFALYGASYHVYPHGPAASPGDIVFETDRSNRWNWLIRPWHAIASRSAWRRRERETEKAIVALVASDYRASRNVGIPNRSAIEQVTRCRRDC